MNFELKTLELPGVASIKADAVIVIVSDTFRPGKDPISTLISSAIRQGDFELKAGKQISAYQTEGVSARRLIVVCAGAGTPKLMRQAVGSAITAVRSNSARVAVFIASGTTASDRAGSVYASVLAAGDAAYLYTTTKSKTDPRKLATVTFYLPQSTDFSDEFARGTATVSGMNFAKEWGNRPANYATPTLLAEAAQTLGKLPKIKVEVLGPKEVAKLGMGSFMSVAQGSAEPLRFVVLKYEGGAKAAQPYVLVGKGITFDSGGISIKPGGEMDEMKFDMCGAASVLGVFTALAELKPSINVIGLIAASENMPDAGAVKPSDVVTSMSGQTIEILNTDAEGRLVLCDALTYAERFNPKTVVDIATLTGACVVALGSIRSGMFSPDDDLSAALSAAGEQALDPCWRMPLDDEYAEGLKTNFADVANVAGRAGGAITAAKFLHRFTSKFAWAHLDIAGTAWKGGGAKGSTGRPVPLLVNYLMNAAAAEKASPAKATKASKQAGTTAKTAAKTTTKTAAKKSASKSK